MKKILIVSLVFLLVSCGKTDVATEKTLDQAAPWSHTPAAGAMEYEDMISTVSDKIKETSEFDGCMQTSINMCIQTSATQVAKRTKSTEFCNELTSTDQKESCAFAITLTNAQETSNPSLCETLSDTYKHVCVNQLYRTQAVKQKDPNICAKIGGTQSGATLSIAAYDEQSQCQMDVIVSNLEFTSQDCTRIVNENIKSMCLATMRQRTPAVVNGEKNTVTPTLPSKKKI